MFRLERMLRIFFIHIFYSVLLLVLVQNLVSRFSLDKIWFRYLEVELIVL